MTDAGDLPAALLGARNADGGWPCARGHSDAYSHACSWTEPTALALLALQAANVTGEARSRAAEWLARRQSADGGWPPCDAVRTSTWVTSLVLLALGQEGRDAAGCARAAGWLAAQVYPEATAWQGFLERRLGLAPSQAPGSAPFYPGTAGWVVPTAFSILALSCWAPRLPGANIEPAVKRAQAYLLARRCPDGGWNHGGSLQRSEASPSYPETTGLALVALAGCSASALAPALRLAEGFFERADSAEGFAWLRMGLAAHGRKMPDAVFAIRPKTTRDIALELIARRAPDGDNPLLRPAL